MAKLKKETIDELDLELLSALYYLKQATATDLEKELEREITKAGISKRLKWLAEKGYLEEPEIDISTGKLRKVYKAPSKEKLESALLEWYKAEIIPRDVEIDTKEAFEIDRNATINMISAEEIKKLLKGIDLKEATEIFGGYAQLFGYELYGLVKVENGKVKLTKKGLETAIEFTIESISDNLNKLNEIVKLTDKELKAVLDKWIDVIKEILKELRKFDKEAYKKLLAEFCKDL